MQVSSLVKGKPTLEEVEALIYREPQPVVVSGFGKLREAATAAHAWNQRATSAAALGIVIGAHSSLGTFMNKEMKLNLPGSHIEFLTRLIRGPNLFREACYFFQVLISLQASNPKI